MFHQDTQQKALSSSITLPGFMEFSSSSSDSDLEEELSRNFRRERREQRGIVRTASSSRSQARQYTLPDGHSIEVRRGCIYIPSREIYVHVLQAVRCPQKWFGDGRIPFRRRAPLSPHRVKLIKVSDATGLPLHDGEISLADATESGFFIFEAVESESKVAASPTLASESTPCNALHIQNTFDPLVDTRFHRITQLRRWRFALKHPSALRESWCDVWSASQVTLLPHEVCCYDEALGLLWKFDGQDGSLYTLRYAGAAVCSQVLFATVPFPPQSCLGMEYLQGSESVQSSQAASFHLIVAGVSHVAILSFSLLQPQSPATADPQVALVQLQVVALRLSNVTCWCTNAHNTARKLPNLWFGAGRSIFKFSQRDTGDWSKSRVSSFTTTDVTALAVQAAGHTASALTIAGMRNGTLQLIAGGARRQSRFDTTVRHKGSDIRYVFSVPDVLFAFVSIARDGEARVWDARFLSQAKDPVCTLLTSRPDGGQAGMCSAALAGNVLAVSSVSTGLTCLDLPLYTTLFHTKQNISPTTHIALGSKNNVDYDLFTFSPFLTQRFELCS